MPKKENANARRNFLRFAGTGVAALAWRTWSPGRAQAEGSELVIGRAPRVQVRFDRSTGLPIEYILASGSARLSGEAPGVAPRVTVCERGPWKFGSVAAVVAKVTSGSDWARFSFRAGFENQRAAAFTLRYALRDNSLNITLEDVREETGFELIEVALPRLVIVREEDAGAWLAHGDDGPGSLAMLSDAKAAALPPNTFWGNIRASMPALMIGCNAAMCVMEATALMDGSTLVVEGEPGKKTASLGTVQTWRVNGSACYDMNLGSGAPRSCGTAKTPNIIVGQGPACRLDFLTPPAGARTFGWLDGAKLVRKRMPAIPSRYYDGKFIYGIRCDEPSFPEPAATFEQCEQIIREMSILTGGAPQIVHLWGWQYRGKDTGYPAVKEVNARIGGYDGLMKLMAAGPKYNALVTFSDNYDDAYRSSPEWDEAIIARKPDGELWKSRNWTGEDSYIIGMAKYMAGPGRERVRYTCERYKLKNTTHVDVLSYFSIRNDWDPAHPASGIKNLFAGRFRVMEEFRKRGVDVTSESMRYAYIGKMSMFWHISNTRVCPFGGSRIPFQPLVYRQSAIWGEGTSNVPYPDRAMNVFFTNGFPLIIMRNSADRRDLADMFYLCWLPWSKVHALDIESFRREGERTIIGLEKNSQIDIDWAAKKYAVTYNGTEITRDLATTCALAEDRMVFYAREEQELSAPLPRGWKAEFIAAMTPSLERPERVEVSVRDGRISLRVPARRPVIVLRELALRS